MMHRLRTEIPVLILIMLVLSFCSEDFLEVTPQNYPTDGSYYLTEEHAVSALTSAYDPLTWPEFYGAFYYLIIDGASDDCKAENPKFDDFTYNLDDEDIKQLYNSYYRGVSRCNIVLEKVPGIRMNLDLRKNILAEAKFLRALYNWHIVVTFGEAPLVNRVLSADELKQPKDSTADFWEQIETDLTEAAEILPLKSEYDAADAGRATKGAAQALLGKSCLYQEKWEEAAALFEEVINSGEYALVTAPNQDSIDYYHAYLSVFTSEPYYGTGGENNSESVFEIQFNKFIAGFQGAPLVGWGNAGTLRDLYLNSEPLSLGWDKLVPSPDFVGEFEPGDIRKYASVWSNGEIVDYRPGTRLYLYRFNAKTDAPLTGYNIKKTVFPVVYEYLVSPNNWLMIRYADMLLMYAEALYHLGEDPYPYINMVRQRVGLPPATLEMPEALIHERRVELGFEAHRFRDLVRWSSETIGWVSPDEHIPGFIPGKHEYFALPQFEVDISQGILRQNPNYVSN